MRPFLLAFALLALPACAGDGVESTSPDPVEGPAPPLPEAPTEAPEVPGGPADTLAADTAAASTVR